MGLSLALILFFILVASALSIVLATRLEDQVRH